MLTLNRRTFLGSTAAAGAAVAGNLPLPTTVAAAGARSAGRAAGGRARQRRARCAAGQEAADQAQLPAAQLRDADRVFPHRDHAERRVLRALSPLGHSRGRRQDLEARGRRRGRQRHGRAHARRSQERCRPSRSSPSTNARATGAACSQPHVPGVEWGYGAMGCARWKGARLKDVLDKVGLKKEAIEIVFDGADGPIVDKTPDFVKSIPVWKAMEENTLDRLRDERRSRCRTSTAFRRASSCRAGPAPTG